MAGLSQSEGGVGGGGGRRALAVAWIATLWLLFAGTWLHWGQANPIDENRAPEPSASRPDALRAYIADHFGFRGWLIAWNAWWQLHVFSTSTSPEVTAGKDGFLFFTGDRSLESYMGSLPLTDCELDFWIELFRRRVSWLEQRHIGAVLVLVPDKQTVYPENMPSWVHQGQGPSRADRFLDALRTRTTLAVVDARAPLTELKRTHPSFPKTDSHWSGWGAWRAYQVLMEQLASSYPGLAARTGKPLAVADLRARQLSEAGDLTKLLGLGGFEREHKWILDPAAGPPIDGSPNDPVTSSGTGDSKQPRALMFRDSFGVGLMPFLGRHFSRIHSVKTLDFSPSLVASEKPDLVIFEMVERKLNGDVPVDPLVEMYGAPPVVPAQIWGVIDEPQDGAVCSGRVCRSYGWTLALQPNSVKEVELRVDGRSVLTRKSLHLPRSGVAELQPGQKDSFAAGAEMIFDPRMLAPGLHQLTWLVSDDAGHGQEIGPRKFCVVN